MVLKSLIGNGTALDVDVPLDELFRVLSNSRRREVIRMLGRKTTVSLSDVSETIAARENGYESTRELNSKERKRVYVGLYQNHLGKLEESDAIEWDDRSGEIRRGKRFDDYHRVLDAVGVTADA